MAIIQVSTAVLRAMGGPLVHAMQDAAARGKQAVLRIECPPDVEAGSDLLRFGALCLNRAVPVALDAATADLGIAAAMAHGLHASHVSIPASHLAHLVATIGHQAAHERLLMLRPAGAELLVSDIDRPEQLELAQTMAADWFAGQAAVQALLPSRQPRRGTLSTAAALRGGAALVAAATLVACSSVPKPAVPDGSARVPINDPARISQLEQQAQEQSIAVQELSGLMSEVVGLRRQMQEMRNTMKVLLLAPDPEPAKTGPAPAKPTPAPLSLQGDRQSMEITRDGAIFRMFHPFGESNFAPGGVFGDALRLAAQDASAIDIRGFTDSAVADEPNRRVAQARVAGARRWLLDHGIEAARMHARFNSAGHFMVDNSTEAGSAMNRRVEIEIHGDVTRAVALLNQDEG